MNDVSAFADEVNSLTRVRLLNSWTCLNLLPYILHVHIVAVLAIMLE